MVIKQPNGKYYMPYDNKINLSKKDVYDILIKRAEEGINNAINNCGDLHDFVIHNNGFGGKYIIINTDTLKNMGYNGTYEELEMETPMKPVESSFYQYITGHKTYCCPRCEKRLSYKSSKCSCGQKIKC